MQYKMLDIQSIREEPAIVHCSSLLESGKKQLLCVWYQGSYETSGDTKIMLSRKVVDSNKWDAPEILFDFNGIPLGNPVLWKKDRILYVTFSVLMEESWKSSLLFYSSSKDDGVTWSAASLFLPKKGFMPKTQPIQTSEGNILFPLYHEVDYCPYVMIIKDMNNVLFSPLVAETMARNKAIQPVICALDEERLLMFCRTNQGTIWRSISYNNGYSWSICEATKLPNPDSAVDLISCDGNKLLLISNPSASDRHSLQLSVSVDYGESWSAAMTIIEGPGEYSYPCLIQDSLGNIQITYTENRYKIKHVEVSRTELPL